jgi:hypothetical protein
MRYSWLLSFKNITYMWVSDPFNWSYTDFKRSALARNRQAKLLRPKSKRSKHLRAKRPWQNHVSQMTLNFTSKYHFSKNEKISSRGDLLHLIWKLVSNHVSTFQHSGTKTQEKIDDHAYHFFGDSGDRVTGPPKVPWPKYSMEWAEKLIPHPWEGLLQLRTGAPVQFSRVPRKVPRR